VAGHAAGVESSGLGAWNLELGSCRSAACTCTRSSTHMWAI